MTAVLAVLALWLLARLRFPDRPANPNPVPPLLSQLARSPVFSDLAETVADVRGRVAPSLVALVPVDDSDSHPRPEDRVEALRIREDLAAAILPGRSDTDERDPLGVIVEDRASGLAVIRVSRQAGPALPRLWSPQGLDEPRYLLVSSTSTAGLSLRPSFVSSLAAVETPRWPDSVWALPNDAGIPAGAFVFSENAELVGVAAPYEGGLAIVPANTLLAAADDLLTKPQRVPAEIGFEVQSLTPALAIASGTEAGVIVTWVDPAGPAAAALRPGDVIQAVDDTPVPTTEHWRSRMAHVGLGDTVTLRIVNKGAPREAQLKMTTRTPLTPSPLGLTMRPIVRVGTEVVRVDRSSAADAAGLQPGDVITAIGDIRAPGPARIRAAFTSARRGDLLTVALRRQRTHLIVALQR